MFPSITELPKLVINQTVWLRRCQSSLGALFQLFGTKNVVIIAKEENIKGSFQGRTQKAYPFFVETFQTNVTQTSSISEQGDVTFAKYYMYTVVRCNWLQIALFIQTQSRLQKIWKRQKREWWRIRQPNIVPLSEGCVWYTRGNHWLRIGVRHSSRKESSFPTEMPLIKSVGAANH